MIIICNALQNRNSHLGLTGISFVYIFLFAFAFVWTPCQALYPSEVSKAPFDQPDRSLTGFKGSRLQRSRKRSRYVRSLAKYHQLHQYLRCTSRHHELWMEILHPLPRN
jgi:hypothetical protein